MFTIADGELQTTRYYTLFQRSNVEITPFLSWTYENVLLCLTFKRCVMYQWSFVYFDCCLFQSFYKLPLLVSGVDMLVSCKCHVMYTSVVWLCITVVLVSWLVVILTGLTWHLRKTNWMGEPTDALDNEVNSDCIILPKKSKLRLVRLRSTCLPGCNTGEWKH